MPQTPIIPRTVTVHLGAPTAAAENVTVSFPDYIKNVASSEIYPTWPENALRANIYAQISFALNRIYTEYYRSRGYDFDITNNTAYDQYFVKGRDIFSNISQIVDEIFNNYVRRVGTVEPLFTQYCNGTTSVCDGLSQWGTVPLAEQGLSPLQILQRYYGNDIELVTNAPIRNITPSYPGIPLRLGSISNDVTLVQTRLNRISQNYPLIPKIYPVDDIYGQATEAAVRAFQRIFSLSDDGIVGKATWYRIIFIFDAVKRLNELDSEGLVYEEIAVPLPEYIQEGDTGDYVRQIQFYLNYIGRFVDTVSPVALDGIFGPATRASVEDFQRSYGLAVDGIVGRETYNKMVDVYLSLINSLPPDRFQNAAVPYPGQPLLLGSEGEDVTALQTYLLALSEVYSEIPAVEVTGVYDAQTGQAVRAVQRLAGLPETGIAGAPTWLVIAEAYDNLRAGVHVLPEQFPGFILNTDL